MTTVLNETKAKGTDLLWVDNRIGKFSAIINGLTTNGVPVTGVSSAAEAERRISEKKDGYDVYFLDFLLEGETSIDLLKLISRRRQPAAIMFVSGYLFIADIVAQIERAKRTYSGLRIWTLDKSSLPMPTDDDFDDFVSKVTNLHSFTDEQYESTLSPTGTFQANRSHLDFPAFSDYFALNQEEQMAYLEEEYGRRQNAMESYFRDYMWVCFCGTWDEPALKATKFEDVWSSEKLMEYGKLRGFAPIAYSRIEVVDDVVSTGCSRRKGLAGYPIAKLHATWPTESTNKKDFHIHFDTGNSITMLCDDTFVRAGWLLASQGVMERSEIGGSIVYTRKIELAGVQVTDSVGATKLLDCFSGIAVRRWGETRFGASCLEDCSTEEGNSGKLCIFRSGLLGRNFQRECGSLIAVNCEKGTIFFVDEPKTISEPEVVDADPVEEQEE